ncbi:MAG: hypothetical protein ACK4GD_08630 [Sphingomonadaceae bacterium]
MVGVGMVGVCGIRWGGLLLAGTAGSIASLASAQDAPAPPAATAEQIAGLLRELEATRSAAIKAQADAAKAQADAAKAAEDLARLERDIAKLTGKPVTGLAAAAASPVAAPLMARTDDGAAVGKGGVHLIDQYAMPTNPNDRGGYQGLMAYIVNPTPVKCPDAGPKQCGNTKGDEKKGKPAIEGAEPLLTKFIGKTEEGNKLRLDQQAAGPDVKIAAAKESTQATLRFDIPLNRRRMIRPPCGPNDPPAEKTAGDCKQQFNGTSRPVSRSLTVALGATIPTGQSSGVIAANGDLSSSAISFEIGIGQQLFARRQLLGTIAPGDRKKQGQTVEESARQMVAALAKKCAAAKQAFTAPTGLGNGIFLPPDGAPPECSGEGLLRWAFHPDTPGYRENVAAYNNAIWNPAESELPRHGFGGRLRVSRAEFPYLTTANFVPGIFDLQDPRLLTTIDPKKLLARSNGQTGDYDRFDISVSGYAFLHRPKSGIMDGFTLIASAGLVRDWDYPINPVTRKVLTRDFCTRDPVSQAVADVAALKCQSFKLEPAVVRWGMETSIEGRIAFSFGDDRWIPSIGFAPKFAHNTTSDRFTAAFPLFIGVSDKNVLNGGIQFAHASGGEEDSENIWSIFLSTPLNLAGNR